MNSLKEWATIVKALESGEQTVILRKGGILETASGFRVESKKFWLFPTYEHQEFHHIKPNFHKHLEFVKQNRPSEGSNDITSYAQVLAESDVSSDEQTSKLSEFHIWSEKYIDERKKWKPEKPLKALFLKVYKIPSRKIPMKSEYQGCKSWIEINANMEEGEPVLDEQTINSMLNKFKEIVN